MVSPGTRIKAEIVRYSTNGNVVVRADSEEYSIHETIRRDVDGSVIARTLSDDWASLSGWGTNSTPARQGWDFEKWVRVTQVTDDGGLIGVGVDDNIAGEVFFLGQLRCSIGTRVPIIPVLSRYTVNEMRIGFCTSPQLWPSDYTAFLANITETSVTQLIGIENSIQEPGSNLSKYDLLDVPNTDGRHKNRGVLLSDFKNSSDNPIPRELAEDSTHNTQNKSETRYGGVIGLPGEVYGVVERKADTGRALGTITREDGNEIEADFGKLDCEVGDIVPVLPITGSNYWHQLAICTDIELWETDSYIQSFIGISDTLQIVEAISLAKTIIGRTVHSDLIYTLPEPDLIDMRYISNENDTITDKNKKNTNNEKTVLADRDNRGATISEAVDCQGTIGASQGETEGSPSGSEQEDTIRRKSSSSSEKQDHSEKKEDASVELSIDTNEVEYTETRRRVRDASFTSEVRDAYDEQCAVCGVRRISPDGSPEVEAAHIHPKGEDGPDIVQNGLALCRLHHWAFDAGWISFTDSYDIIVKNTPERDGYEEFTDLHGNRLILPENEELRPHTKFIVKHRSLHNFDEDV